MLKITKKISFIIALLFAFQISSPVFAARSVNELKKEIQKRLNLDNQIIYTTRPIRNGEENLDFICPE